MAVPTSHVKNNTMGSIVIRDGSSPAVTLALEYDRGDLSISGLSSRLNALVKIAARGKHKSECYGDRTYPSFSFSAWLTNVVGSTSTAPGSMLEFLTGLGAYQGNAPIGGTGRPVTVDIVLTVEGTSFGDASDEVVTCKRCFVLFDITEGAEGNTISVSGEILGSVQIVNGSNTVTYGEVS